MTPLKIAHIICTFPPYKGGMGNVVYHEAKELARAWHEVVVFTVDYKCKDVAIEIDVVDVKDNVETSSRGVSIDEEFNFKVKRLGSFLKFGNAAFLPQLLFKLYNFDIVILHYPFFGAQEIIWLAKKLGLIKKLVIFYHMEFLTQKTFFNSVQGRQKHRKHPSTPFRAGKNTEILKHYLLLTFFNLASLSSQVIYNSLLNSADKILVSSLDYAKHSQIAKYFQNNKNKFIELPFGADTRICTHPHCLWQSSGGRADVSPVKLSGDNNRAGTGLHRFKDDKIILFVGALDKAHYFKGVDILLKTFKRLIYTLHITHYTLHIVGDGDLRPKYEQQAQELGLACGIKFLGKISDDELQKHYASCDVLVLPSITSGEAFGLVLVEAMAHSKPVIASDLPGVRTVCQNNFNGLLVKPRDVDDLTEKIKIILENEELALKMGERGRKLVEEKYNWQKHGEKLNKVFINLI